MGEISIATGGGESDGRKPHHRHRWSGHLPLGNNFELFGKLGIGSTKIDASASAGGFSASASDSGSDVLYGFGATYNFTKNLGGRAEWEALNDSEQTSSPSDCSTGSELVAASKEEGRLRPPFFLWPALS